MAITLRMSMTYVFVQCGACHCEASSSRLQMQIVLPLKQHQSVQQMAECDWIDLVCSTEMGQTGKGAHYKFMIVQPNGKWMQEISDLIEQVGFASCVSKQHHDGTASVVGLETLITLSHTVIKTRIAEQQVCY